MNDIYKSIKRLLDLLYVYAAIWGVGQFIEWVMIFGS